MKICFFLSENSRFSLSVARHNTVQPKGVEPRPSVVEHSGEPAVQGTRIQLLAVPATNIVPTASKPMPYYTLTYDRN